MRLCVVCMLASSAEEMEGSWYKLPGPGAQEESPTLLRVFWSFSVVSLLVDLQINFFRPSPSHSVTESQSFRSSDLV
jgi:hypothetical protein